MRFAPLLLSLVIFAVSSPAAAKSSKSSASSEASVNRWSRVKNFVRGLDRKPDREKSFTLGAKYEKFDAGGRSRNIPFSLGYAPVNSPFSFGFDADGYTWDSGFTEPDREGWGDLRGTIDVETGSETHAMTLGYGLGIAREAESNKTDYTHSLHLGYTGKLGKFSPEADLRASWNNADDPNTWKRSIGLFLGVQAELAEKQAVSFGFVRQIVKGDDSISSLESKYKFPIAVRGRREISGVIGLSVDLEPGKESKSLEVAIVHSF